MPTSPAAPRKNHSAAFFRAYMKTPGRIGAVVPSSPQLGAAMTGWIDWTTVRTVVELGAGTGAMSESILRAVTPDCTLLLIEQNDHLHELLRNRFPDARIVHGSVEDARRHCDDAGIDRADAIISSLPWASFDQGLQSRCMDAVRAVLDPEHGRLATYAQLPGLIMPGGRRLKALLPTIFRQVERSRVVWRNTPPSFVYQCTGLHAG